ncbi:MAG: 2'-5' RNA ligase [Micromonosporaceae bacterium]|nr:2'-5' RNA ligase [Micromonosporaceae bacterium]
MKLDELFPAAALGRALADGYVRRQLHPTLPLAILNYTAKAAYTGAWDEVTLTCRGLVVDNDTGRVVARPFRKFFNYGQAGAPQLDLGCPATVTDKVDGSLGISYPTGDGWAVATRGSFASDQAVHASAVLRSRYAGWSPPPGFTVLFEVVYPGNRVVCDYGDLDDLVLLGAVEVATGRSYGPAAVPDWPGPVVPVLPYRSLAQALAAPPRPGAEGLVVHLATTDQRVKIKQEEYVALHRIVTGLNARAVWEHISAQTTAEGQGIDHFVESLPDEFHGWVWQVVDALTGQVERRAAQIARAYRDLVCDLPEGWTRKDFALAAATDPLRWALFATLDGKDIRPALWREVKPEADWTPSGRSYTEDTA